MFGVLFEVSAPIRQCKEVNTKASSQEQRARSQDPAQGMISEETGPWSLEPEAQIQMPGARSQEQGARSH